MPGWMRGLGPRDVPAEAAPVERVVLKSYGERVDFANPVGVDFDHPDNHKRFYGGAVRNAREALEGIIAVEDPSLDGHIVVRVPYTHDPHIEIGLYSIPAEKEDVARRVLNKAVKELEKVYGPTAGLSGVRRGRDRIPA